MATVSDKKLQVSLDWIFVGHYLADVVMAGDYYPFGMAMPLERRYSQGNSGYRYGFNGQEKDDDVTIGNYTAKFWEYDSRIGRRWNLDPVMKVYESPYLCFNGNPILLSDFKGNTPTGPGDDIESGLVYNIYATQASITNTIIRLTPSKEKRHLKEEFAKAGITDEIFINNYQIRMRTIVTNYPPDPEGGNFQGYHTIENKFVVEPKTTFGREMLEAAFDVLAFASIVPGKGTMGVFAARGGGTIMLSEIKKSMGILFNVRRYSTVGVNNALRGVQKLEDVMEAGMVFVGKNAKKLYTKSGRFEGWESGDRLKRFRPSAYKKNKESINQILSKNFKLRELG